MGFFDTVGKMASAAGSAIKETTDRANELAVEYESESDDFLKRKLQSGSFAEKMAAGKILKSRGYGKDS